jgi:hypothetical protein
MNGFQKTAFRDENVKNLWATISYKNKGKSKNQGGMPMRWLSVMVLTRF